MGSAALTLCHVAMGAIEGYHSDNLMPWDVAAGVLIIKEAGGIVIDTNGTSLLCYLTRVSTQIREKNSPRILWLSPSNLLKVPDKMRIFLNIFYKWIYIFCAKPLIYVFSNHESS